MSEEKAQDVGDEFPDLMVGDIVDTDDHDAWQPIAGREVVEADDDFGDTLEGGED